MTVEALAALSCNGSKESRLKRPDVDTHPAALGRRAFFRTIGGASALAATAAASALGTTPAEAYHAGSPEQRARYRADAPDVQSFYRTNGYESLKK